MQIVFFLVMLLSLNAFAQSGGFYKGQDCVQSQWQQSEIVGSKNKLNIHSYDVTCKTKPSGEVSKFRAHCVGVDKEVPGLENCIDKKAGIKFSQTGTGPYLSDEFTKLHKEMLKQEKDGIKTKGGFYSSKDCVEGQMSRIQISHLGENFDMYSYSMICKSMPNGEIILGDISCIGSQGKTPSFTECMDEKKGTLKSVSSGGTLIPEVSPEKAVHDSSRNSGKEVSESTHVKKKSAVKANKQ